MATVSILVTVYNREPYLAECLESILASSFTDFEVIVVDDGSGDESVRIAREFEKRDPRIRVFENPNNLGDYPNRNRAAELSGGRYLKYVDSDDLIRPDGLEIMIAALERFPDAAYCLSYPRPVDLPRPALLSPEEAYRYHLIDHQGIFSSGPLLGMIRRDRFFEVGGFRPDARNMGDTILWMELSARWPMVLVEDSLTWWREHEGQEYGLLRGVGMDNAETHCKLTALLLREFLSPELCPLPPHDRKRARLRAHCRSFERVAWHLRHGRYGLAKFELQWVMRSLSRPNEGLPEKRLP